MSTTARAWADGLRELADFIEQHPDLMRHSLFGETFNTFAYSPEEMAEKTAMLGTATKDVSGDWYMMRRKFGPHSLDLNISRNKFCERVQTGTKTVKKRDPDAIEQLPMIEVEEPVYEWICPESVLAHGAAAEAEVTP